MNCDTLAGRIQFAINGESPHSFAKRAGIKDSTFRSILGGTSPSSDKLVAIAETAGISIEWLATGRGPMRIGKEASPIAALGSDAPMTDARLMGRLSDQIAKIFKEMGRSAPLHQIVERAAAYHDRIVATVSDPDERLMAAGELLADLRRELRTAEADPTNSKRSA